jgi:sugar/nucleoside kinase (ribokinase family)
MTCLPGILQAAEKLAEECLAMGCAAVLVKCGLSGMICRTGLRERITRVGSRLDLDPGAWTEQSVIQPCFQAETVCSTGAGDVSIAAYLTALLNGESPEACARLAAAEGAASVTSYDALGGILPLEELKRRITDGWKTMEDR